MNIVILIGRLTRDPELRYTAGEDSKAVTRFTLAVDRKYKREDAPQADFISCAAFGKTAEFVNKYFLQGSRIAIDGHWQTDSYTNRDGNKVYTNVCVVDQAEFADSKKTEAAPDMPATVENGFVPVPDGIDDSLPFR